MNKGILVLTIITVFLSGGCGSEHYMKKNIEQADEHDSRITICRKAKIIDSTDKSSLESPIVIKAKNQSYAYDCELQYISKIKCGEEGTWNVIDEILHNREKSIIKEVIVRCSSTGMKQSFFFDETKVKNKSKKKKK